MKSEIKERKRHRLIKEMKIREEPTSNYVSKIWKKRGEK